MTLDALFIPRWRLRDRTTRLALLLLAAMGAAYLAYLMVLLDRMTLSVPPIHSDFHALWSYARIAMQDGALAVYDPSHLAQAEIVLGRDPLRPAPLPFAFPPPFLLLIWPLGWFGYATGYAVWSCGTLALLLAALPRGRLLVLLAPAAAATIYFGQSGFLFAALLVGGLRLTMRGNLTEWLGGLLLGVAACKPKLGLLVPVALLAMGAWRAIIAACAAIAGLVGLTSLLFGAAIWPTWLAVLPIYAGRFDAEMTAYWHLVPTVEGGLRLLGLAAVWAKMAQVAVALPVLVLVWRCFRQRADDVALGVLCIGTFLVTPHAFVYDLPLAVAGVRLYLDAQCRAAGGLSTAQVMVPLAVLLLPIGMMTVLTDLPVAVPILATQFAIMLLGRDWLGQHRLALSKSALPPSA